MPFFRAMLCGLEQTNPALFWMLQNDLSGIYLSEQGDKRVIRFFLRNYLKKIHNRLKVTVLEKQRQAKSEMMSEEEEGKQEHVLPPAEVTICRMIG